MSNEQRDATRYYSGSVLFILFVAATVYFNAAMLTFFLVYGWITGG